ncbi:MAG: 4Fe-4S dicluster domain-containing protein [Deltaproteobacteria bacterium]|nr:4Fe-4S dicluster domain-containing protein [Deltaproteobacteria bacterium]
MTAAADPTGSSPAFADDPDFGKRPGDAVEMFETCTGCAICRDACPMFVDLFGLIEGRDTLGDAGLIGNRREVLLDKCFQCGLCVRNCPIGFDFPAIAFQHRMEAAHGGRKAGGLRTLAGASAWRKLGSILAPVANWLLGSRLFRWLMEKLTGIDRRQRIAPFSTQTFSGWFRKRLKAATGELSRGKVLLIVSETVNGHYPAEGQAAVELLEKSGFEVKVVVLDDVGERAFASGLKDEAVRNIRRALRQVQVLLDGGFEPVASNTELVHFFQSSSGKLLDSGADSELLPIAARVRELTAFMWDCQRRGLLPPPRNEVHETVAWHSACTARALGTGESGYNLLKTIPGLDIRRIDAGCCGLGGGWGAAVENFEHAQKSAAQVVTEIQKSGVSLAATACAGCRVQIAPAAVGTAHPVELYWRSVGE